MALFSIIINFRLYFYLYFLSSVSYVRVRRLPYYILLKVAFFSLLCSLVCVCVGIAWVLALGWVRGGRRGGLGWSGGLVYLGVMNTLTTVWHF